MYIQHSSNTAVRYTQFAECEEVFFIAAGDKKSYIILGCMVLESFAIFLSLILS